jgi:hypothetical protein
MAGHGESRKCTIFLGKPEEKALLRASKRRWGNNIRKTGIEGWIGFAWLRTRGSLLAFMNTLMNLWVQ